MIKFIDVTKQYELNSVRVAALNNVSFEVDKAEILGIYGPSGSGKSTILKLINKLVVPNSGLIYFNDIDINKLNKEDNKNYIRKTSLIFQNFNLVSNSTILTNVSIPLLISGLSKKDANIKALESLNLVGLKNHANKYPNQLSGGEQQRVAIARALVSSPEILLCDEITSSLDYYQKLEILNLLKKINKDLGITIILVSHEHEVIKYLANRVIVIEKGEIIDKFKINNENLIKGLTNYKEVFNYAKWDYYYF